MFSDDSRYKKVETLVIKTATGQEINAIKLRKLPVVAGKPYLVKQAERIDVLAYTTFKEPLRFWHIADANTELEANKLVAEPGSEIYLPET